MSEFFQAKHILVITLSNLGDVVLTTPVIAALREHFPEAKLSVLVGERPADLFLDHPWIHGLHIYNKKASIGEKLGLIRRLRSEHFDLVLDLRRSLFPWFIGAKKSNSVFRQSSNGNHLHAVDEHLSVLSSMSIPISFKTSFPLFNQRDIENTKKLFRGQGFDLNEPYLVVAPGARSHLKRWSAESYRTLMRLLGERLGVLMVLVGDKSETAIAEKVRGGLKFRILNLCGETNVRELASILSHAELVVTNDSATLHMADQQARPTVAIFGPTDEKRYGPRGPDARIIRKELFCSPCGLAQCPYKHECLKYISVEEVFKACIMLLKESRSAVV